MRCAVVVLGALHRWFFWCFVSLSVTLTLFGHFASLPLGESPLTRPCAFSHVHVPVGVQIHSCGILQQHSQGEFHHPLVFPRIDALSRTEGSVLGVSRRWSRGQQHLRLSVALHQGLSLPVSHLCNALLQEPTAPRQENLVSARGASHW